MEHTYRKRAEAFLKRHGKKRIWHGALTAMAAVVVFITSYMLILPAITLSQEPVCGLEAHTHTAQCNPLYDEETGGWIYSCGLEAHVHTDACYPQAEPEPVYYCGLDEHVHGADCYKLDTLICMQTEHIHGAECLQPRTENQSEVQEETGGDNGVIFGENGEIWVAGGTLSSYGERIREEALADEDPSISDGNPSASGDNTSAFDESSSVSGGNFSVSGGNPTVSGGNVNVSDGNVGAFFDSFRSVSDNDRMSVSGSDQWLGDVAMGDIPYADEPVAVADDENAVTERGKFLDVVTDPKYTGTGTEYDSKTENYTTRLNFEFTITLDEAKRSLETGGYYMDIPAGVIVPDGLLEKIQTGTVGGTTDEGFYFVIHKRADGTYYMDIDFDETYLNKDTTGATLKGSLYFSGTLIADNHVDENGNIHIAGDNINIDVSYTPDQYKENERYDSDIQVEKNGQYLSDGNILRYTLTVYSFKGTAGSNVTVTDVLKAAGLPLTKEPSITVKKGILDGKPGVWKQLRDLQDVVPKKFNGAFTKDAEGKNTGYEFTMELDPLTGRKTSEDSTGAVYTGEGYEITVEYSLDEIGYDVHYTPDNTVTGKFEHQVHRDEIKQSASKNDIDVHKKSTEMGKTGVYLPEENKIKWEITLNQDQEDIAGKVLTDSMFAGMQEDELKSYFSPSEGFRILTENGVITGVQFEALPNSVENTHTYVITYYTENASAGAGWEGKSYTNKAEFGGQQKEVTVKVGGGTHEKKRLSASKTEDGRQTLVEWETRIRIPSSGLPANEVKVTDELREDWDNLKDTVEYHYMTRAQMDAFASSLYKEDVENWFSRSVGDLSKFYVVYVENGERKICPYTAIPSGIEKFCGFEFTFVNGVDYENLESELQQNGIVLHYQSTAETGLLDNSEDDKSQTYYNSCWVNKEKRSDSYTYYYKKKLKKMDKDNRQGTTEVTVSPTTGELIWKVRVVLGENVNDLLIVDTLPAGVTLKAVSWGEGSDTPNNLVMTEDGSIAFQAGAYTEDVALSGSYKLQENASGKADVNLHFTLQEGGRRPSWFESGKELWIKYTCVISADEFKKWQENTEDRTPFEWTYENSVTVEENGASVTPQAVTQTQQGKIEKEEPKKLRKGGEYAPGTGILTYTVEINEDGDYLLEEGGTLTLEDVLTYEYEHVYKKSAGILEPPYPTIRREADLDITSVTLKDENGRELGPDKWSLQYQVSEIQEKDDENDTVRTVKKTITAKVPDGQHLFLTYKYKIEMSYINIEPDKVNTWTHQLQMSNVATLTGIATEGHNTGGEDLWQEIEAGGSISSEHNVFSFYKVDEGNSIKTLEGAQFSLYEDGVDEAVDLYTTDAEGGILIYWENTGSQNYKLQENTLYYIKETKAPEGYLLPEDPEKYYFYFADTDNPEWDTKGACNLTNYPHNVICTNSSLEDTELDVEKVWVREDTNFGEVTSIEDLQDKEFHQGTGSIQYRLYRLAVTDETGGGSTGGGGDTGASSGAQFYVRNFYQNKVPENPEMPYADNKMFLNYPDGTEVAIKLSFHFSENWQYIGALQNTKIITDDNISWLEPSDGEKIVWKIVSGDENSGVIETTLRFTINSDSVLAIDVYYRYGNYTITDCTSSAGGTESGGTTVPNVASGGELIEPDPVKYPGYTGTLTAESGWKTHITGLPSKLGKVKYKYYVVEVGVDGNPVDENNIHYLNNLGIDNGKITIINRGSSTYELPNTGGAGTRLYTLGGLFATALAGLLLYRKSRGKEERFSS